MLAANHQLEHSASGRSLMELSSRLRDPAVNDAELAALFKQGIRELKDTMTAHHEAGHVLAYLYLTPRQRLQLDDIMFTGRTTDGDVQARVAYTWISEPCWPDPAQRDEVIRELACVMAGKFAEPELSGGVQLEGSDRDDQVMATELLGFLPEVERHDAIQDARRFLEYTILPSQLHSLASYFYGRWIDGETVVTFDEVQAFLAATPQGPV